MKTHRQTVQEACGLAWDHGRQQAEFEAYSVAMDAALEGRVDVAANVGRGLVRGWLDRWKESVWYRMPVDLSNHTLFYEQGRAVLSAQAWVRKGELQVVQDTGDVMRRLITPDGLSVAYVSRVLTEFVNQGRLVERVFFHPNDFATLQEEFYGMRQYQALDLSAAAGFTYLVNPIVY